MEGLSPLYRRVAGIDVHKMLHVVTTVIEHPDGTIEQQSREFGGFKRDCRALASWLLELDVELVVMESTGIYWKSIYAHLERAGIQAWVVNAHFVKHVPGRKTDMNDSQWLAVLARFGLVRGSFIPPQDLRELRLVSRYRRKLTAMRASEINRLHKILDDGGIKLGGVVSDLNGLSARAMVTGLIEGKPITALLDMARGRLKPRREDLQAALDGDLTARHRFILKHIHEHIEILERSLAELDAYILAAMAPYQWAHRLLQTIPGIDQIASALILIEIGDDMARFGSADRIAAWAALCPGNNESAGKRKSGRTGKGSSVIRYIMCECANSAWKTRSSLASKYKSLMVRKTHKKAIIALAHKMIRLIFLLLTRKVAYHDPQIDYQAISAKKNAPRWIKQLRVIGQWPDNASTSATT
ncbi:IS110 family transposase ISAfe3 [Paraburkholderia domus]|uniref:IS110 family transposase n=1 Tax=Paraburkholderia domus TaxID=2793075 RepID=UPI001911BB01|nr:IS110 family transposase [Paraburkholderia domus]MBK5091838.1 IS110 family transposase [Burkholderia sp. R-69927]CAE6943583.1 IS110 family transposase ISAfe3 [Paraburkholderia domus]